MIRKRFKMCDTAEVIKAKDRTQIVLYDSVAL